MMIDESVSDNRRICKTCRFWVQQEDKTDFIDIGNLQQKKPTIGVCMRYPPSPQTCMYEVESELGRIQLVREELTNYPKVHEDAFCGEYQTK